MSSKTYICLAVSTIEKLFEFIFSKAVNTIYNICFYSGTHFIKITNWTSNWHWIAFTREKIAFAIKIRKPISFLHYDELLITSEIYNFIFKLIRKVVYNECLRKRIYWQILKQCWFGFPLYKSLTGLHVTLCIVFKKLKRSIIIP